MKDRQVSKTLMFAFFSLTALTTAGRSSFSPMLPLLHVQLRWTCDLSHAAASNALSHECMFQPLAHLVLSASTTGVSRSLSSAAMWDAHLRDVVTRARESWLLQRQPLRLSFSCSAWFGQVAAGKQWSIELLLQFGKVAASKQWPMSLLMWGAFAISGSCQCFLDKATSANMLHRMYSWIYSTENLGQKQTSLQAFWPCMWVPEVTHYKGSNIRFEDVCLSMP